MPKCQKPQRVVWPAATVRELARAVMILSKSYVQSAGESIKIMGNTMVNIG